MARKRKSRERTTAEQPELEPVEESLADESVATSESDDPGDEVVEGDGPAVLAEEAGPSDGDVEAPQSTGTDEATEIEVEASADEVSDVESSDDPLSVDTAEETDQEDEESEKKEKPLGLPLGDPDPEARDELLSSGDDVLSVVEALIFASGDIVTLDRLAHGIPRVGKERLRTAVQVLAERYREERRPFEIVEISDGFRVMTRSEFYPYLARMKRRREIEKLTPAALETMAIIAYRQPVTRAEVESIRGVSSDAIFRTLADRKLIKVTGRAEVVGRPLQYGTTDRFLDMFGLSSLRDLPRVEELEPR